MRLLATAAAFLLASCGGNETPKPAPNPKPGPKPESKWENLFDGKTLGHWKPVSFGGEGDVFVKDGSLHMNMGAMLTGIKWTGPEWPRTNYEFALDAMKVDGNDFFVGIAFPVGDTHCSFVAGGWGGGTVGLSSIDGEYADENETHRIEAFKRNHWYAFRLRVTPEKIVVWIDEERFVDFAIGDHKIEPHPAVENCLPFGLTNWITSSAFRNIRLRRLP